MAVSFDGPIERLLPHRGPMLWVDRLLADDPDGVRVEAVIRRDGIFVDDHGLPVWAGVELMAQAVGAWAGLRRLEAGDRVRLGFLLGTRRYDAQVAAFPVGATLEIDARRELQTEQGLAVFACTIFLEGQPVASAHLNVFQPPDVEAYLQGLLS